MRALQGEKMLKRGLTVAIALGALTFLAIAVNKTDEPAKGVDSGLRVGEMAPAYDPTHVAGPDKGTETCPVCKYGKRPAVQAWINGDDPENMKGLAEAMHDAVVKHSGKEFKAFIVVVADKPSAGRDLQKWAETLPFQDVAVTFLPKNSDAIEQYKINLDSAVKNTVFVYRDRKIDSKFVNLKADDKGKQELLAAIDKITK
jgi:protocatechuate 3,4-dioxygenase, beta subunit